MVTFHLNYFLHYFIIIKRNIRESIAVVDELAEIQGKLQPLSALLLQPQLNLLIGVSRTAFSCSCSCFGSGCLSAFNSGFINNNKQMKAQNNLN